MKYPTCHFESPEEAHQIMDGCFKILMDEIHRCEGTINQFTGDGVMALFGAPVAHEYHARQACSASLSIQKAMEAYGERIREDLGLDFKLRIGLNSGLVIVGAIGDDLRMDYTAVGDTTNLASWMQTMAGREPHSIKDRYRYQGCGGALIDHAKGTAKEIGIRRMGIDIWHFNEPARKCFSRQGFKTLEEIMWVDL